MNELTNAENESRKIEIESVDQFVTLKYPEKVISIIHCSCFLKHVNFFIGQILIA